MEDYIKIKTPINELSVFQAINGNTTIALYGEFSVSCKDNYPVIKVINIENEQVVVYDKVNIKDNLWDYNLKLSVGMYRIETGILLKITEFNPIYLAKGQIIRNVFVGEIFVIAGQSNAQGFGREQVNDLPAIGVSMYNDKWQIATHPIGHMDNKKANTDTFNSGHSPWLKLGKLLLNENNIPVGLIPTALNGSSIDLWKEGMPLYDNMIKVAKENHARNLIWYQGCTNVFDEHVNDYYNKLDFFIKSVIENLQDIDIYIIQISGTTNKNNPDKEWCKIREYQRRIANKYNLHLITTYDLNNYSDDIHLSSIDNIKLAERVYDSYINNNRAFQIEINKADLELEFKNVERFMDIKRTDISIRDENEHELNADLLVNNNIIKIINKGKNPIRYISLPFGRLFHDNAIKDNRGNYIPYFCLDMESDA